MQLYFFQIVVKDLSASKTSDVLIGKNGISSLQSRATGLWPTNLQFFLTSSPENSCIYLCLRTIALICQFSKFTAAISI